MVQYVTTSGFKELEKALLELDRRVALKVSRKALRTAGNPILKTAREMVPVHEGRLKRSLRLRVDQLREAGVSGRVLSALIYVSGSLGPRPRKTARRSRVRGKLQEARYDYQIGSWPNVYGQFVEFGIPGHRPHPFMRPAWDSQGGNVALKRLGDELGSGIEREFSEMVG